MEKIKSIIKYGFLFFMSAIFLFPFLWMLINVTNESTDIIQGTLSIGDSFGDNFSKLINETNFLVSFKNSMIITSVGVVLTLFVTSIAAYAFEFLGNKMTDRIYALMILSMMVPFAALMVPLFKLTASIGLANTFMAIILQGATSVFLVFFFRQSIKEFPFEMIEAARIDGLSEFRIYISMFIPSMKSTYIAAAIFSFLAFWNNYLWPLIVIQSNDKQTLTLFIASLGSSYTPDHGVTLLAVVLSSLPAIIFFFAVQKQFVEGMIGSGK